MNAGLSKTTGRFFIFVLLLAFLFPLSGCGGDQVSGGALPSPASSSSPWVKTTLEGPWNGYEEGASSQWNAAFGEAARTFKFGNSTGTEWYKGTYSVDTGTTPRRIELSVEDSSDSWYIGKISYGIYKIENNTLSLAFFNPGVSARPASFTAFNVSGLVQRLFVLTPYLGGTPSPAPVPTPDPNVQIPTPMGFNALPADITGGTLDISLDSSIQATEACLLLVYHSANPSYNGNLVPLAGSFFSGFIKSGKAGRPVTYCKPKKVDSLSDPYSLYLRNNLKSMQKNYELAATLLDKGIRPRPLTASELKARGALDKKGRVKTNYVGHKRTFWIDFSQTAGFYLNRLCTCHALGEHCYVYVDDSPTDGDAIYYRDMDGFARAMAAYFDTTIYPLVHQKIGSEWNPGIDGDPRVYIVLSANFDNAYFQPTDEYPQDELPPGYYSNYAEIVYIDPRLLLDESVKYVDDRLEFLEAVCGHEFAHLARFNQKYVESYAGVRQNLESGQATQDQEYSVGEGTSIFTENVLLGRSISNNFPPAASMRAQGLERYLRIPERCPLTSYAFNANYNNYLGIYETGFLNAQYAYERMGYDALARLNQADGRTGLASLRGAAADQPFELYFDELALTLLLSGRTQDPLYNFGGADLTGRTDYGGTRLHQAWSALTNIDDYNQGFDVGQLLNYPLPQIYLVEWAPMYFRFFNMGGKSLNIHITGLVPNAAGSGNVKAYFFYR
ncbi:MAG: hypothetical protein V2A78_03370 [bacterium]